MTIGCHCHLLRFIMKYCFGFATVARYSNKYSFYLLLPFLDIVVGSSMTFTITSKKCAPFDSINFTLVPYIIQRKFLAMNFCGQCFSLLPISSVSTGFHFGLFAATLEKQLTMTRRNVNRKIVRTLEICLSKIVMIILRKSS